MDKETTPMETMVTNVVNYMVNQQYLLLEVVPIQTMMENDPFDAFPEDFYQQTDNDGDGCETTKQFQTEMSVQTSLTSTNNSRQGCPDADNDSWADVDDMFPNDPLQWEDTDLDGWGDNYMGKQRNR